MASNRRHWFDFVHSGFTGNAAALVEGLKQARALHLDHESAFCCLCLCSVNGRSLDSEALAQYSQEALDIYRRLGDAVNQAWALYHQAFVPKIEKRLDDAEALLLASLEAFRKAGSLDGAAWNQFALGLVATERNDAPKAEKYYEDCLHLFESLGAKLSMGWTLVNLLRLVVRRGDMKQGRLLAQQGLALFEEVNYQAGKAWCIYYLAEMAFNQDDFDNSWSYGQQSLKLLKEIDNALGVAWSLCNLQRTACLKGDFKAAIDMGHEGAACFRAINDPEGEAVCLRWLGVAEEGQGRAAEARAHFLEALSRFVALRINWRILELLVDLGNNRLKEGDRRGGFKLLQVTLNSPETPVHVARNVVKTVARLKLELGPEASATVLKEARLLSVELAAAEVLMKKG